MKRFLRFDRRMLWGVLLALLVLLTMTFNTRMAALQQLREERDAVSLRVTQQEATAQTLQTQIAYATSDAAVEQWAREQGRMVREGDQPIVPVTPAGATPAPVVTPEPTPRPVQNWQVWAALFFGSAP